MLLSRENGNEKYIDGLLKKKKKLLQDAQQARAGSPHDVGGVESVCISHIRTPPVTCNLAGSASGCGLRVSQFCRPPFQILSVSGMEA